MKRKLTLIAAGLVLASAAQADPTSYLSVGFGQSTWNEDCTGIAQCDRNGAAVRIVGGHEFVKGVIAIEGVYLNLGKIKGSGIEIKGQAVGIGVAAMTELAQDWRGTLRLGLASVHAKASGAGLQGESETSAQAYIGGGIAYAVTPSMFVEANFDGTRVKLVGQTENVTTFTLGLGWRF